MKSLPKIKIGQKPIYKKIGENVNFIRLFKVIEREYTNCFLFESLGEEDKFSRYSLLGFYPQYIISAQKNNLIINDKKYIVKNPYYALENIMPKQTLTREYSGGLVGYIGYDTVNYLEPSVKIKTHNDFPAFMFGVYTDGIILDKLTDELYYFHYLVDRSAKIEEIIHTSVKKKKLKIDFVGDSLSKNEHAKIVERVKEKIASGNTFQCEVGFKTEYAIEGDTFQIYEKLRKANPSPFMYYLKFDGRKIIGASPELLFSLREGEMTTRPLAGTIRRGKTKTEDQLLARKLLHDSKEQAEHKMLVDMHRNDIGRVAEFGTVKVRELMSLKKFSHVQHISSEIIGRIRQDENMFSGLASNFPMGTTSGTPKVETIKIIDANEPTGRGPYAGGVGHFGFNGDCTFALTLRSLFISDTHAYAQTSGGIVADSVIEKEYEEIQNKLAAMKNVLTI